MENEKELENETVESKKELTAQHKAILAYLEDFAKNDNSIAEALKNEKKNIFDCWNYIMNQAKKELKNNSGYISDDVVYQWARHYYLEEIKPDELKAVAGGASNSVPTTQAIELTEEQKKEATEKAMKRFEEQQIQQLKEKALKEAAKKKADEEKRKQKEKEEMEKAKNSGAAIQTSLFDFL